MQWCINNYRLYEIYPTGPAHRLATQQVGYGQKRKLAVAAQIAATLTISLCNRFVHKNYARV